MWEQHEVRERVGALDGLLTDLATQQESPGGAAGMTAVQALIDVYGEALARIMDVLEQEDSSSAGAIAADELVSHLLLAHDLHPVDPATRIHRTLAELQSEAKAELLAIEDGVATVRLDAGGCGTTVEAVRSTVQTAVQAVAPEAVEVRVEMAEPDTTAFVPLSTVRAR